MRLAFDVLRFIGCSLRDIQLERQGYINAFIIVAQFHLDLVEYSSRLPKVSVPSGWCCGRVLRYTLKSFSWKSTI